MRTAVVRVDVDPTGRLTPDELTSGMAGLAEQAGQAGIAVIETDVAAMPPGRRQVQLLVDGTDADEVTQAGVELCTTAFGTTPTPGVVTYLSRGTDDDAHGVLAGFGLAGDIRRSPGDDGLDVVYVTLREDDLQRVPESRIQTALEAALNDEVHILTT